MWAEFNNKLIWSSSLGCLTKVSVITEHINWVVTNQFVALCNVSLHWKEWLFRHQHSDYFVGTAFHILVTYLVIIKTKMTANDFLWRLLLFYDVTDVFCLLYWPHKTDASDKRQTCVSTSIDTYRIYIIFWLANIYDTIKK